MSNNIKYGSRILDMGVLLEMKALVNANGGVSRCIMECRQLACEVRHSQQLLDKLSCGQGLSQRKSLYFQSR